MIFKNKFNEVVCQNNTVLWGIKPAMARALLHTLVFKRFNVITWIIKQNHFAHQYTPFPSNLERYCPVSVARESAYSVD